MDKLKPCPFCGGEAATERDDSWYYQWSVWCTECGATFPVTFETEQEAIDKWNKRAAAKAIKVCIVCGKELPKGSQAKYCDECRANKHKKFCTVCGAEIPKGSKAKYCGDCRLERKREHVKNNHMVELAMQAKRKKAKLKWVWRGDQK